MFYLVFHAVGICKTSQRTFNTGQILNQADSFLDIGP